MRPPGCHLDDRDLQVLKQRKHLKDEIGLRVSRVEPVKLTKDKSLLLIEHSHAVLLERGNQNTSISPSNSCPSKTSC